MAKAATIDDIVKPEIKSQNLDSVIDSKNLPDKIREYAKTTFEYIKTTFNYGFLATAGVISYGISGLAGPVTSSAMMFGKVLLDLKKGIKTEWNKLYKEGWKGIILGNLAKTFYQNAINIIPNKTFYGKIGRALAYNPGFMGGIYNPVYLKSTEVLDKKVSQKGEWKNLTKRIFKCNFIPHYLATNYIQNVQQQVAASAFLGTAYRVLAG